VFAVVGVGVGAPTGVIVVVSLLAEGGRVVLGGLLEAAAAVQDRDDLRPLLVGDRPFQRARSKSSPRPFSWLSRNTFRSSAVASATGSRE